MKWVTFTRRTNDPKLACLEHELKRIGIKSRRHGESFHAPILQVGEEDLDAAWKLLAPVDDIPDDDPRWYEYLELLKKARAISPETNGFVPIG